MKFVFIFCRVIEACRFYGPRAKYMMLEYYSLSLDQNLRVSAEDKLPQRRDAATIMLHSEQGVLWIMREVF